MNTRTRPRRLLAIGLDGYERTLGEKFMATGDLPALTHLRDRSATFVLDHGPAQRTGLTWEHVSSGRSPEAAQRWSAICFDPRTYGIWQEGTSCKPFTTDLNVRTVVFDAPYYDLDRAPSTHGIVNWGAHDPGVEINARPMALLNELESRFGAYPAKEWLYGIGWPTVEHARRMGDALVHATDMRAEAACWLLRERLPDWQLAIVVAGELHSAIEGLWHGIDPAHPLYQLPSAAPAREGLSAVYRAVDRLVAKLVDAFSDATIVLFSMGGMGPNRSDVPSMVLLPELLYRHAFGRRLLREPKAWTSSKEASPMLGENENWSTTVNAQIRPPKSLSMLLRQAASRLVPALGERTIHGPVKSDMKTSNGACRLSLDWMPASRYQPYWHAMRFFALPSFSDGRIRVNLFGREYNGTVPFSEYDRVCDEVEDMVRACRDATTGELIVDQVERCVTDPRKLGSSEADLVIVWRGAAFGIHHPTLGRVGPVPCRRTGGHTGPFGMAYVSGDGTTPGEFGLRSSFDVVPTILDLLGESLPAGLSGSSLLAR